MYSYYYYYYRFDKLRSLSEKVGGIEGFEGNGGVKRKGTRE